MNMQKEKNTYRYHLMQGGEVVEKGITYDLVRREASHQLEFPGSCIKQIGQRTTHEDAMKWERREAERSCEAEHALPCLWSSRLRYRLCGRNLRRWLERCMGIFPNLPERFK